MRGRQGERTVERFFDTGADQVLSWCPTCNIQFGEAVIPGKPVDDNFGMDDVFGVSRKPDGRINEAVRASG